ncbi:MAG: DUF5996 family protein [Bacteroidales bacterium]
MDAMINKEFLSYTEWKETADTLHMYLQMAGKVKLERNDKSPEWGHVRMYLTIDGLSTDLIPGDIAPFSIHFNLRKNKVEFKCGNSEIIIPLQNDVSVADFYQSFMEALSQTGAPTKIDVKPQEVPNPIDFTKDKVHHTYDQKAAVMWLDNMLFAYQGLMRFIAPFRGRVTYPSFYFGAIDLACCAYSGESAPYASHDAISQYAFDERLFECGFWPGDDNYPEPAFYALPYPFMTAIGQNANLLKPSKALFDASKKEFLFNLKDAFSYKDPVKAVYDFCESSFLIQQMMEPWRDLKQITKPLDYTK